MRRPDHVPGTGGAAATMSRKRTRLMSRDRLKRHEAGIRRLDEAFGGVTSRGMGEAQKRSILQSLGFNRKATDE